MKKISRPNSFNIKPFDKLAYHSLNASPRFHQLMNKMATNLRRGNLLFDYQQAKALRAAFENNGAQDLSLL